MDDQYPGPGLPQQAQLRTFFRLAGPVIAVVGGLTSAYGFISFLTFGADADFDAMPVTEMALFMGGFIVFAIGMAMCRAGYGAIAARYASGELSPVLRDSLRHTGLTPSDRQTQAQRTDGPYCRECGTQAPDRSAKFCASCGTGLG